MPSGRMACLAIAGPRRCSCICGHALSSPPACIAGVRLKDSRALLSAAQLCGSCCHMYWLLAFHAWPSHHGGISPLLCRQSLAVTGVAVQREGHTRCCMSWASALRRICALWGRKHLQRAQAVASWPQAPARPHCAAGSTSGSGQPGSQGDKVQALKRAACSHALSVPEPWQVHTRHAVMQLSYTLMMYLRLMYASGPPRRSSSCSVSWIRSPSAPAPSRCCWP